MVDADIAIEGIVETGKLLTLTAQRGAELGFVDLIASSRREVLAGFGLAEAEIVEPTQNWAEKLARFLTDPTVSSLLLIIGFLGLVFEVMTPGWGVPGTVGILALFLFFGGRLVVGLAGWGVIGLFILGFVLLLIEVFIIPGFGITGISGIIAIFASLVLSFRNIREASFAISFAMIASFLVVIVMAKHFGKSKAFGRLVLRTAEHTDDGYSNSHKTGLCREDRTHSNLYETQCGGNEGERIALLQRELSKEGCMIKVVKVGVHGVVVRARVEQ